MDIVKSLRFMRKRSGMSQEELAPKLFMSRANLSKIERGDVSIRVQDYFHWVKETNSQDVIIAMACSVDLTTAADVIANLTSTLQVGLIILGGIL